MDISFSGGAVPAIVQDDATGKVLMLGYMTEEAFEKTRTTNLVTFYSRSRGRLWTKGETSGNFLDVRSILIDCDKDTILIKATPRGPVCHTGSDTCFGERNEGSFLRLLEGKIADRKNEKPEGSYTALLFSEGLPRIAQKVGEEAVETVIEAMKSGESNFCDEAADLVYHLMVLLSAKGHTLDDVESILRNRHAETVKR